MKWIKFFLMFALPFATMVNGNESESQIQEYENANTKRICGISDNLNSRNIQILLHDGTLWHCFYEWMHERQSVITKWYNGQVFHFVGMSHKFSGAYYAYGYGHGSGFNAMLHAYLDPQCYNLLPYITEKTDGGLVSLSDGSVWEETYQVYSGMQFWNPGERVFVNYYSDQCYRLFNVDQFEGLFYESRFASAKLIRLNDQ